MAAGSDATVVEHRHRIADFRPKKCRALQKPDKFAARSELTSKKETRVRKPHAH